MKPKPPTLAEREAKRAARMAIPGRLEMRQQLFAHRDERKHLEHAIAEAGKHQRRHGPLNKNQTTALRKARADLDALNESVFTVRKQLKG